MAMWQCISNKKPFFNNRQWEFGEIYNGEEANKYFEKVDKDNKDTKDHALLGNIKAALQLLDHEDSKVWTMQDLPVVKEVEKLVGFTISRGLIEEAFPGFKRDMKPLGKEKVMKS